MSTSIFLFFVFFLVVSIVDAHTAWYDLERVGYSFKHFVSEYGPEYDKNEEIFREKYFVKNLAMILNHNRGNLTQWKMGVSHLTDRTPEEFKTLLGYRHIDTKTRNTLQIPQKKHTIISSLKSLPESVDWRQKGAVTSVKKQGFCGSCWAFSTSEAMESHWFLKTGKMMDLSAQQIASCTKVPQDCLVQGAGGCNGSSPIVAFNSLIQWNGVISEWRYPYQSVTGINYQCRLIGDRIQGGGADATLQSVSIVQPNSYEALMDAIANVGPIAISVDASTWHHYSTGIYDGCSRDTPTIDHSVQLVGYGTDTESGNDFWIVRNSWGVTWGEKGYIRILREKNPSCANDPKAVDCEGGPTFPKVCGMCGILYDNSYPVM